MRRAFPLLFLFLAALTLSACDSSSDVATANSTVRVIYEGRLEDGTVFNSRREARFSLQQVIPGFRTNIVGMRVGDSKTFSVPPDQGYGNNPPSGIPVGATLVFDVTLLSIE